MAEANGSLQLDPMSLLLSQNNDPQKPPVSLKLITESYFMERGPRYKEYAQLRESKLRRKNMQEEDNEQCEPKRSPLKKQVRFQSSLTGSRKGSSVSSVLAQSVPDFSATLRKENRKPVTGTLELTPPSKNWSKTNGNLSNSRGSKSASAGEKKGMMARKSYASIDELKGLSMGVTKDLCGENRGRTGRTGVGKTVLGSRQFSMFG
ncbi:Homeobox Hox-B3-like protein [Melia azedarach]|uniref:Homeobox Hox-B3-like protein n=1 Tax=Melia azedarach TaxID=155640 RepID=A0ACC1X8R3_MELAZ|nr:Homeobox Hox-B3-like protein [Melia azedarach]